ncbi:helix-turn-helix domain-containing protein [Beijerinckia indica]|uniref:helix-turn-helix domain-containing protein n=1 Tax=Beijerinckia indica TaxID=533 RepID=UPI00313832C4
MPLVSSDLIAKELGITPRAAALVATLGLRELTGRGSIAPGGLCEGSGSRFGKNRAQDVEGSIIFLIHHRTLSASCPR